MFVCLPKEAVPAFFMYHSELLRHIAVIRPMYCILSLKWVEYSFEDFVKCSWRNCLPDNKGRWLLNLTIFVGERSRNWSLADFILTGFVTFPPVPHRRQIRINLCRCLEMWSSRVDYRHLAITITERACHGLTIGLWLTLARDGSWNDERATECFVCIWIFKSSTQLTTKAWSGTEFDRPISGPTGRIPAENSVLTEDVFQKLVKCCIYHVWSLAVLVKAHVWKHILSYMSPVSLSSTDDGR
jgi:hypothetical protein